MPQPELLMCQPDFFRIQYEINPWMNRARPCDRNLAMRQWTDLRVILKEAGAKVSLLDPVEGLPDLVFTANAGLIFHDTVMLSHFRYPQRQGEEPHNEAWFSRRGMRVRHLPKEMVFEGAGDGLFCGDTLFAGYRIRSDALSHQHVASKLRCRVILLELVNPYYYHLDTCFCPIAPGLSIYYPAAFDRYAQEVLSQSIDDLIELDADEAECFAANAVVVGKTVVTNTGCTKLHRELRSRGLEPIETPLGEFVKSGGSAKCLTLRLDGEEAASWKYTTK